MPSPATSRPNLRSARIVDGRSWFTDVRCSPLPKERRNPFAQCNLKAHARHKFVPWSSHSHRRTDSAAPCFKNPKSKIQNFQAAISSPPLPPPHSLLRSQISLLRFQFSLLRTRQPFLESGKPLLRCRFSILRSGKPTLRCRFHSLLARYRPLRSGFPSPGIRISLLRSGCSLLRLAYSPQ